jgi:carboxynorspermidine decarboxylase
MNINPLLKTPYYMIDETLLEKNLKILKQVKEASGAKILLAQKAFSSFYFYPLINQYLDGTTASGLYEARLAKEKFGKEIHIFGPAYKDEDIDEMLTYADHIVFNSISQFHRFKDKVKAKGITMGIRINPEKSTQDEAHLMYDPCAVTSRMGVRLVDMDDSIFPYVTGFHFHTLCQQNADALEITLKEVETKFGKYFKHLKWLNFGGGHHITRDDYDRGLLIQLIQHYKAKYKLDIYLEPGEAVVLNAGFLVGSVIDIVHNDLPIAMLDVSPTCHMPDVIEMPMVPDVTTQDAMGTFKVRLAGATCLSGDNFGVYSFKKPLTIGDKIAFEDAALYTIVKTTTFNGMPLPSLYARTLKGKDVLIKSFSYDDFVERVS